MRPHCAYMQKVMKISLKFIINKRGKFFLPDDNASTSFFQMVFQRVSHLMPCIASMKQFKFNENENYNYEYELWLGSFTITFAILHLIQRHFCAHAHTHNRFRTTKILFYECLHKNYFIWYCSRKHKHVHHEEKTTMVYENREKESATVKLLVRKIAGPRKVNSPLDEEISWI